MYAMIKQDRTLYDFVHIYLNIFVYDLTYFSMFTELSSWHTLSLLM